MKLYRNSYTDEDGDHAGFEFFVSKVEAHKVWVARHKHGGAILDGDWSVRAVQVDVGTRKAEIVSALNKYASHPIDNGGCVEAFVPGDNANREV